VWITDTKTGSVIEWNTFGAPLSPSGGFPAGGGPIAIDANGNIWISGNGVLHELTNLGSPLPWSPFGGVAGGGGDIALDGQGDIWITNSGGVNEFNNLGQQLSPVNGYTVDGITGLAAVGVDSSSAQNVWIGTADSQAASYVANLTNPGGQLIASQTVTNPVLPQMAADGSGNMWFIDGQVCKDPPSGGKGSIFVPTCFFEGRNSGQTNNLLVLNAQGIAVDGAGIVWVANPGDTQSGNIPAGVLPINASDGPSSALPYVSSSLAAGTLRVAIDGSGNIWVLLANNTVTEYVGAATPVVTPIALALRNKKVATKP
jgi:hypothetical protein